MKNRIFFYFLLIISLLISCSKENEPSGCNINGFWVGYWKSALLDSGSFVSSVTQQSNDFNGNVYVNSYTNGDYANEYSGTVKNKEVNSTINFEGVKIMVNGNIQDDSIVVGNFKVPYLNMNGVFNGKKISNVTPQIKTIYHLTSSSLGESLDGLLYIGDHLWILTYPYEYINQIAKVKVIITDLNGNVTGQTYFPYTGGFMTSDGEYVWSFFNGTTLTKYDTIGNKLNTITISALAFLKYFAIIGSNLYFTDGNKFYKTNQSAKVLETLKVEYIGSAWKRII